MRAESGVPPGGGSRVRRLMPVAGRLGWGLGDQALSSLTNFGVGILIARTVTTDDFGAFALAFAWYVVALNGARAVATAPLSVRYSTASLGDWRRGTAAATGMAFVIGIGAGGLCLAVAALTDGGLREAFLALAITLPGLLVQDAWRFGFFAGARNRAAFVNDGIWALVLFPILGVLTLVGSDNLFWPVLTWGGAATVAALAGIVQSRVVPRPSRTRAWWREHSDIAPRFLGEFATSSFFGQLTPYAMTAVAGLTAVGTLRAGELLLGPFNILFQGIYLVAVPEGARVLRSSVRLFRAAVVGLSITLCAAALVWGGVILLIPDALGTLLLGENWAPARTVVLPLTLALAGLGLLAGAQVGLRVLAAARRSLRARVFVSSTSFALVVGGTAIGGAVGAAWASALANLIGVAVWSWQFRGGLRDYLSAPLAFVPEGTDRADDGPRVDGSAMS